VSSSQDNLGGADATPQPENQSDEERYQGDLQDIAEYIRHHQCILFLGSAVHAPAPPGSKYSYPREKSPPFGERLSKMLGKACQYPKKEDPRNLQRVALYFEKQAPFPGRLHKKVRDIVEIGREPSPILRGLARMGFPIVITTNYDHLYEEALSQVARERAQERGDSPEVVASTVADYQKWVYTPKRMVTTDCDSEPTYQRPYLLKIHGDIDRKDSMVITDEDYIDFILRMNDSLDFRPVGENVRKHLLDWPTLFIGYRLGDYNLRLLFKTLRWNLDDREIPENYSVDIRPDVLIRYWWEERRKYVRFITKDLWQFVPDVYFQVMGEEMPQ